MRKHVAAALSSDDDEDYMASEEDEDLKLSSRAPFDTLEQRSNRPFR